MTVSSSLSGRHALVCGASAGIGRASAIALAQRGAQLTLLARRVERLEALIPELLAAGASRVDALQADLDDREGLGTALDTLLSKGPVHILLHNTGGPPAGPLLEADLRTFETAFGRHVLAGQLLVTKVVQGWQRLGMAGSSTSSRPL